MDITIALMRKKPGMLKADFIEYYETRHVPLVMNIIGRFIHSYERHYLDYEHKYTRIASDGPDGPGTPFDVVTRVIWKDLESARQTMADPKNSSAIAEDERNFLDRTTMQNIIVPTGDARLTTTASSEH